MPIDRRRRSSDTEAPKEHRPAAAVGRQCGGDSGRTAARADAGAAEPTSSPSRSPQRGARRGPIVEPSDRRSARCDRGDSGERAAAAGRFDRGAGLARTDDRAAARKSPRHAIELRPDRAGDAGRDVGARVRLLTAGGKQRRRTPAADSTATDVVVLFLRDGGSAADAYPGGRYPRRYGSAVRRRP